MLKIHCNRNLHDYCISLHWWWYPCPCSRSELGINCFLFKFPCIQMANGEAINPLNPTIWVSCLACYFRYYTFISAFNIFPAQSQHSSHTERSKRCAPVEEDSACQVCVCNPLVAFDEPFAYTLPYVYIMPLNPYRRWALLSAVAAAWLKRDGAVCEGSCEYFTVFGNKRAGKWINRF